MNLETAGRYRVDLEIEHWETWSGSRDCWEIWNGSRDCWEIEWVKREH